MVAIAIIVLLFDALVLLSGDAPLAALGRAAAGTWGTPYGLGQVLYKATPLIFSALAFDVAYRAGLFNIGAEGQIALGSLAAGVVAARLPPATPWLVAVPTVLLAAVVAGAAWASIAGAMRAWLGAHEVIATIMQNRLADALVPLLLAHGLGATGFRTADAIASSRIPRADRFLPALSGSALSLAFPLAVAVAFGVAAWQRRSRVGREIDWIGQGEDACAAEGIPVARRRLFAMALGGGLAGLAASAGVLGYKGYHETGMTAGTGFAGVAVALLGGKSPVALVGAALLVGTLQQAGLVLNATVPKESMDVLFGVVILVVAVMSAPRAAEAR
jgi:simple sugar transport system permease protein